MRALARATRYEKSMSSGSKYRVRLKPRRAVEGGVPRAVQIVGDGVALPKHKSMRVQPKAMQWATAGM